MTKKNVNSNLKGVINKFPHVNILTSYKAYDTMENALLCDFSIICFFAFNSNLFVYLSKFKG